ncbi:MAG: hypothetical protein V4481_02520 [Patescibacteria group bacterium]
MKIFVETTVLTHTYYEQESHVPTVAQGIAKDFGSCVDTVEASDVVLFIYVDKTELGALIGQLHRHPMVEVKMKPVAKVQVGMVAGRSREHPLKKPIEEALEQKARLWLRENALRPLGILMKAHRGVEMPLRLVRLAKERLPSFSYPLRFMLDSADALHRWAPGGPWSTC